MLSYLDEPRYILRTSSNCSNLDFLQIFSQNLFSCFRYQRKYYLKKKKSSVKKKSKLKSSKQPSTVNIPINSTCFADVPVNYISDDNSVQVLLRINPKISILNFEKAISKIMVSFCHQCHQASILLKIRDNKCKACRKKDAIHPL